MTRIRTILILLALGALSACSSASHWDNAYSQVWSGEVIDMEAD